MRDFIRKLDQRIKLAKEVYKETYGAGDPFKGYTDLELQAMERSHSKEVEESRLARKIQSKIDKDLLREIKDVAEAKLKAKFPDARDPNSQLSKVMELEMDKHELHENPNGRLIAARLAALEIEKGETE